MKAVNDELRAAAEAGDESKLKALLRRPGFDARSKDEHGRTALMWAAFCGHLFCVQLLLPVSDVLSKSDDGWTASDRARFSGYNKLADFIDAYVLAMSEMADIQLSAASGDPRKSAALRV